MLLAAMLHTMQLGWCCAFAVNVHWPLIILAVVSSTVCFASELEHSHCAVHLQDAEPDVSMDCCLAAGGGFITVAEGSSPDARKVPGAVL